MRTDIIKVVPVALICTGATLPDPVGLLVSLKLCSFSLFRSAPSEGLPASSGLPLSGSLRQLLPVRDLVPCLPSGRAVGSCPVPSEGLPAVPLPPVFGLWCACGVPIMRTDIIKAVPAAPDPVGLSP